MAPAWSHPDRLRAELHRYMVELTGRAKYKNAGTVDFLVDNQKWLYFIKVNPRIQVRGERERSKVVLFSCFCFCYAI